MGAVRKEKGPGFCCIMKNPFRISMVSLLSLSLLSWVLFQVGWRVIMKEVTARKRASGPESVQGQD